MRAFITGIGGFAGGHLYEYLLRETDWQVSGCTFQGWERSHLDRRVIPFELDLRDASSVRETLEQAAPDFIFHLAAQSFVAVSWNEPWETIENNIRAELNVLDALVKLGARPRVLIAGSNEEYGLVRPEDLPLNEGSPLRPNSPYAVSKIAQDMLGLAYFLSYRIPIVRIRAFNHIGPRQSELFAVSAFARQLAEMEAGIREPLLRVGNLDARRDFTDVRDVVRAYHLAITRGEPGEVYNVGSGRSWAIREIVDQLVGYCKVAVAVEQDPALMRPSDAPEMRCDPSRIRNLLGWEPAIPLEQTLRDTLNAWRQAVGKRVG